MCVGNYLKPSVIKKCHCTHLSDCESFQNILVRPLLFMFINSQENISKINSCNQYILINQIQQSNP